MSENQFDEFYYRTHRDPVECHTGPLKCFEQQIHRHFPSPSLLIAYLTLYIIYIIIITNCRVNQQILLNCMFPSKMLFFC